MNRTMRLSWILRCVAVLFALSPCHAEEPLPAPSASGRLGPIKEQDPSTPPSQKSPLELPPPPDRQNERNLTLPPLEPGDRVFPINLAVALRLSDARPIIVAATV